MNNRGLRHYNWKLLVMVIVCISIGDWLVDPHLASTRWPYAYDFAASSFLVIYLVVSIAQYRKDRQKEKLT